MKKYLIVLVAALFAGAAAYAQPKAIGLRGGLFGLGYNAEISYEHWGTIFDNDYDFVEAELGVFAGNGFKGTLMYNFTFAQPEFTNSGEWAFYAGPGLVVGYGTGYNRYDEKQSAPFVGAAFQLGLEYTFVFPLQLSIDFRPTFMVPTLMNRSEEGGPRWYGIALSGRYAF